jgi:NADPH-dependent 2,4-dienoyl-CoA reductase/sulfur reductase-like enzyme
MKIIVIGSLAAGMSAAEQIAGGTAVDITVYEKGSFYSCGACGLPHYLTESIDTLHAAIRYKEDEMNRKGIKAFLRHEVMAINPSGHEITVHDINGDRTFTDRYDRLVVATGNQVLIPYVEGSSRIGVQTLKSVEDLLFLKEYTKTPYVKDIVVLGGSYSGIEIAKAFSCMGRNVRIIEKERHILPDFDTEVSDAICKELEKQGINITLGENVTGFPGQTFIEKVQTDRGSYDCDLCISAIGVIPESSLLKNAGAELAPDGAVLIDSNLQTSLPDIYAIGACTECRNGSLRTSSLRTHDFEIARTGLTEDEAKRAGLQIRCATASGNDRPGIVPDPHKVTIKLVYEANSKQLVGAQAWGEKNVAYRINAIAVAIAAGMTAQQLAKVDFCYSSSNCSVWDPIQIAAEAAAR